MQAGKEVMLRDDPDHPMLLNMVDENYIKSLAKFKQLVTYANVRNDVAVHYCTAALRTTNRFKDSVQKHGTIVKDHD
jgi:Putative serine esterase (DUF676)